MYCVGRKKENGWFWTVQQDVCKLVDVKDREEIRNVRMVAWLLIYS
jgi:hypothetical protein